MTNNSGPAQKWILLVLLVAGITFLHYSTDKSQYYFHIFYGELYFLPIALAAFWFGLHGALLTSVTITACYLSFIILHWQGFSENDLDRILSVLLYNGLAGLAGVLKEQQEAARKKLLQTENLAILGRSLAAAAHDMKSPLMLIGGFSRRILKKMSVQDPARPKLALVVKEIEKMESMVGTMLNFSKPLTLNRIQGDVGTILQESLSKIKEVTRRHNVAIKCRVDPGVMGISFDPLRLEQVIVNLVINAIEASPEGSTVSVILSRSPTTGLILDVADHGCGITYADRQQVFDPFFTTKKEGTGLGLPIVKKIVEEHGWSLQVLDNFDRGTIFRINLMEM